jgi:hypothetical protein
MKSKISSMPDDADEIIKRRRKERSEVAERSAREFLQARESPLGERAESALRLFGDKIAKDVEEQFEYVEALRASIPLTPSKFVELEIARLLRMLEKRKEMIDRMQSAMMLNAELAESLAEIEATTSSTNTSTHN